MNEVSSNDSCNVHDREQTDTPPSAPSSTRLAPLQKVSQLMTPKSFFSDMQVFLRNCLDDQRLTPKTQLLYRTLVALYNQAFWTPRFVATDSHLMAITHIKSKADLNGLKSKLRAMGYIDYSGKPTRYTVYSPPDCKPDHKPDQFGAPQTPQSNYTTIKHNYHKERNQAKKEVTNRDHDNRNNDSTRNSQPSDNPTPSSQNRKEISRAARLRTIIEQRRGECDQ